MCGRSCRCGTAFCLSQQAAPAPFLIGRSLRKRDRRRIDRRPARNCDGRRARRSGRARRRRCVDARKGRCGDAGRGRGVDGRDRRRIDGRERRRCRRRRRARRLWQRGAGRRRDDRRRAHGGKRGRLGRSGRLWHRGRRGRRRRDAGRSAGRGLRRGRLRDSTLRRPRARSFPRQPPRRSARHARELRSSACPPRRRSWVSPVRPDGGPCAETGVAVATTVVTLPPPEPCGLAAGPGGVESERTTSWSFVPSGVPTTAIAPTTATPAAVALAAPSAPTSPLIHESAGPKLNAPSTRRHGVSRPRSSSSRV